MNCKRKEVILEYAPSSLRVRLFNSGSFCAVSSQSSESGVSSASEKKKKAICLTKPNLWIWRELYWGFKVIISFTAYSIYSTRKSGNVSCQTLKKKKSFWWCQKGLFYEPQRQHFFFFLSNYKLPTYMRDWRHSFRWTQIKKIIKMEKY